MAKIGINLLVCNAATKPLHHKASVWALDSILDSDLDRHDWRVAVVDNGSTCPATAAWLAEVAGRPNIRVSRLPLNVGIARGRNEGYRLLEEGGERYDFVVSVHNDHLFPNEWLGPLLETFERDDRVGIVGPGLITGGGQWRTISVHDIYSMEFALARTRVEAYARASRRQVVRIGLQHPAVKRMAMLEEIAPRGEDGRLLVYDEGFPAPTNFEDLEEAYRAYKAGWRVVVNLASYVFHYYHFSRLELTDCDADYAANRLYMDRKHGAGWTDWDGQIFSPAMGVLY